MVGDSESDRGRERNGRESAIARIRHATSDSRLTPRCEMLSILAVGGLHVQSAGQPPVPPLAALPASPARLNALPAVPAGHAIATLTSENFFVGLHLHLGIHAGGNIGIGLRPGLCCFKGIKFGDDR